MFLIDKAGQEQKRTRAKNVPRRRHLSESRSDGIRLKAVLQTAVRIDSQLFGATAYGCALSFTHDVPLGLTVFSAQPNLGLKPKANT
jgi:hypothetical protein